MPTLREFKGSDCASGGRAIRNQSMTGSQPSVSVEGDERSEVLMKLPRRRFLGLAAGATALPALPRFARADPVQIRAAWVAPVESFPSMWLFKKELARHFGKSYVFEPVHFAGTPPMVTAIANNEVQIGELAYSTLPIAIKNAGLDDIRVIADDLQDGVDGYWTVPFAVLKDGPIKKVEDLKGKIVATNAEGSAVDVAMKAMLHKHLRLARHGRKAARARELLREHLANGPKPKSHGPPQRDAGSLESLAAGFLHHQVASESVGGLPGRSLRACRSNRSRIRRDR
jgi:hypothetical protein